MKDIIENRIKLLFKTKELFCESQGYTFKNFSTLKLKGVEKRIAWVNKFLKPLNLKIEIVDENSDLNNP